MSQVLLSLDVGQKRIGVAIGNTEVSLASPLVTLQHTEQVWTQLQALVDEHEANALVVGLPRGLDGQETGQTRQTQEFVNQMSEHITLPTYLQDEAVTSVMAETELQARGKPYVKEDIDALAATYILQDYLDSRREQAA